MCLVWNSRKKTDIYVIGCDLFILNVGSLLNRSVNCEKRNSRGAPGPHLRKTTVPNSRGYLFNAWINSAALLFYWQSSAHTFSIHHTNSFVFFCVLFLLFGKPFFSLNNQQKTRNRQTQQIIPKQLTKLHVSHNLSFGQPLKLILCWILSVSITTESIFFICDIANFDCKTTPENIHGLNLVVLYIRARWKNGNIHAIELYIKAGQGY